MISEEELHTRLINDLESLRLPVSEVQLVIRPFSKSFFGRYFSSTDGKPARVFIYPYKTKRSMFSYSTVLYHAIHEMVHHLQFTNPSYRRIKGVMHDPQFYLLFNRYYIKALDMSLLRKEAVVK